MTPREFFQQAVLALVSTGNYTASALNTIDIKSILRDAKTLTDAVENELTIYCAKMINERRK